ncbi:MAG: DoxX family protein [Nanoarchaeota archaeon]|nr:DoxX family protein [Nanoarchaeota archaeon]|tara:strand:+ start:271 stop:690 length:420 start_codon:yes stop_codon:yes gene_type:complete
MYTDKLSKYSEYAPLFLRLGVGVIFLVHGIGKLFSIGPLAVGVQNFSGFLAGMGVPAALVVAWIVALVETLGGIAILIGFQTRCASLLVAINIGFALILVHLKNGFANGNGGFEFPLLLFLATLTLLFMGAGKKLAIDK